MHGEGGSVTTLDPDRILEVLTGRMTGQDVAVRLGEPTREVVPQLNRLYAEGTIDRTVSEDACVRFAPADGVKVAPAPTYFVSMSLGEEIARRDRRPQLLEAAI